MRAESSRTKEICASTERIDGDCELLVPTGIVGLRGCGEGSCAGGGDETADSGAVGAADVVLREFLVLALASRLVRRTLVEESDWAPVSSRRTALIVGDQFESWLFRSDDANARRLRRRIERCPSGCESLLGDALERAAPIDGAKRNLDTLGLNDTFTK